MGIERVVRAYALPDNVPPKRVLKAGQVDVEDVVLEVGRDGGQGKPTEGSYNATQTFYVDASDVEIF